MLQSKISIGIPIPNRLFTMDEVQKLLKEITGADIHGKIFSYRIINLPERSHYALMTQEMYEQSLERMKLKGLHYLQFFPIKEPRTEEPDIIAVDPEINGFDESKFIFVDTTFDVTDVDRTIVVRETDGTLRTANPEEHDRMNRIFFEKPSRPVNEPPLFKDPWLQVFSKFILLWILIYQLDKHLCRTIFDRVVQSKKFSILHSTRHYGPFVFYLLINNNIAPLLNYYGSRAKLELYFL
ncbi:unnamed protein product [Dracunculus medinensis]|uniref:Uncharacterized protein n=1 Tax=Dracunculus medinensis TaxID=318479 RepID=A0A0N4UPD2_DRAME|nr:unnamed protein product [Dracunculus medinensis]